MVIALPLDQFRIAAPVPRATRFQVAHDEGPVVAAVYGREAVQPRLFNKSLDSSPLARLVPTLTLTRFQPMDYEGPRRLGAVTSVGRTT